jgi:hypothetical protein
MRGKKAARKKMGRPSTGKRTVSIRLKPETLELAKNASAAGGNMSAWIEDAIIQKSRRQ